MKKCERGDEITGAYHDGHSPAPMALRALLELRRAVGGDGGPASRAAGGRPRC